MRRYIDNLPSSAGAAGQTKSKAIDELCHNYELSSKTVKFELSLEKLTVKFEGDIQVAERFQSDITNALSTLASAQNRLLPPNPPATPATIELPPAPAGRRRRRRKGGASGGIDPAILDATVQPASNGDGDANSDGARRTRRAGSGPSVLVLGLKADGFFREKRSIGAIRDALAQKGHSLKSNEVSPTLVSLTQQGELKREKNTDDQWEYFV